MGPSHSKREMMKLKENLFVSGRTTTRVCMASQRGRRKSPPPARTPKTVGGNDFLRWSVIWIIPGIGFIIWQSKRISSYFGAHFPHLIASTYYGGKDKFESWSCARLAKVYCLCGCWVGGFVCWVNWQQTGNIGKLHSRIDCEMRNFIMGFILFESVPMERSDEICTIIWVTFINVGKSHNFVKLYWTLETEESRIYLLYYADIFELIETAKGTSVR